MRVRDGFGPQQSPLAHWAESPTTGDPATQFLLLATAGLSAAAAGIHFAVTPSHLAEAPIKGYFFMAVAMAQALWATVVPRYPYRRVLLAGAYGNLLLVAVWLLVRVRGLPIGEHPWTPEAFGVTDTIAATFQIGVAVGVRLLHAGARPRVRTLFGPTSLFIVLLVAATSTALLNAGMAD